jgi:hypothetical protein
MPLAEHRKVRVVVVVVLVLIDQAVDTEEGNPGITLASAGS